MNNETPTDNRQAAGDTQTFGAIIYLGRGRFVAVIYMQLYIFRPIMVIVTLFNTMVSFKFTICNSIYKYSIASSPLESNAFGSIESYVL